MSSSHQYSAIENPAAMADAPERYYPPSDPEPVQGYYAPHARDDSAPQVVGGYTDGDQGAHGKEVLPYATDVEGKPKQSWRKRSVCGIPILTAIIVALVIIAAIIGGVVGGVVGSQAGKSKNAEDTASDQAATETGASSSTAVIDATSTLSSITTSSTSTAAKPTRTEACPEFDVDVRSDYWHSVTNMYQSPMQYLSGAYNPSDNNSVIKTINTDENIEDYGTTLDWQFLKIKEPHPLAKLGCESKNLQTTIYKIACRSTEPHVDIRLGLDPVTWSRATGGKNTSEEILRLRLAVDDNEDLSQLWYTKKITGDGEKGYYEWIEVYNYMAGKQWRLSSREGDAQAFMWSGWETLDDGTKGWTRWHRNTTELVKSPWFGY